MAKDVVLVIDDNISDLKIISNYLKNNDYDVITTSSPTEAISILAQKTINCIIVDNRMPEMDGKEFCRRVKSNTLTKNIPIIMLTALEDTNEIISGLEAGADEYIGKSNDIKLIVQKVKTLKRIATLQEENVRLMNQKEEFLYIVSHDLKNPISIINTSLEYTMESQPNLPDDLKDIIKICHRQSENAIKLIHNLLDLGKFEAGYKLEKRQIDFVEVIHNSLFNLSPIIEKKNISINIELKENKIHILGDPERLSQVVTNLVDNAIKYSPENSKINIEIALIYSDISKETILRVGVRDTGPGIPKNKLDVIFEKFKQAKTKNQKKGFGLGLAICQQIVKLHDGTIWCESEEGNGATFFFTLPNVITEKNNDIKNDILIIEESSDIGQLTVNLLKELNFVATTVATIDYLKKSEFQNNTYKFYIIDTKQINAESDFLENYKANNPAIFIIAYFNKQEELNEKVMNITDYQISKLSHKEFFINMFATLNKKK